MDTSLKKNMLHVLSSFLPRAVRSFGAAWTLFAGYTICVYWSKLAKSKFIFNSSYSVDVLRRQYLKIVTLTEEYQRCFGVVILLLLLNNSIWLVNTSFFFLTNIQKFHGVSLREGFLLVEVLKEALLYCTLSYIPTYMQQQVTVIAARLTK